MIGFLPHHGVGVEERGRCSRAALSCKCSFPRCTTRHESDAKSLHVLCDGGIIVPPSTWLVLSCPSHDAGQSLGHLPLSEMHPKASNFSDLRIRQPRVEAVLKIGPIKAEISEF